MYCAPFAQNLWNLWTLHELATTYHARPSTLLGVDDDPWLAYQVDLACLTVGRRVERKTLSVEAGGEGLTVAQALGEEGAEPARPDPRRFGQLGWRVRKKMRVPESGIW